MPYQRRGKCVYVKKGGRWLRLKCHDTVEKAKAHLTALNMALRGERHR